MYYIKPINKGFLGLFLVSILNFSIGCKIGGHNKQGKSMNLKEASSLMNVSYRQENRIIKGTLSR